MNQDVAPPKHHRPVGRPRADGKSHLTRQDVFLVSAKLIAQRGYSGASIRMIAQELNASAASIFHLFKTKAELLNGLIAFAAQPSLAFYANLRQLNLPPDSALFKSIYEETLLVASADRDFASLFYLPELRREEFAAAQSVRNDLVNHYKSLLRGAKKDGLIKLHHVDLAAEQIFQLSETSIVASNAVDCIAPEDQAMATARFVLAGLLAQPDRLAEVEKAARTIDLTINIQSFVAD